MSEGKTLIRYFSMPCTPTKANGGRTRNMPNHDMERVILDVPCSFGSLEEVEKIMETPIDWTPELHFKAADFETYYYKKD